MKGLNRLLAALAVALLMVTLTLLFWLRAHVKSEIDRSLEAAATSFNTLAGVYDLGRDQTRFGPFEELAERVEAGPYVRGLIVAKRTVSDIEIPLVPFKLWAEKQQGWKDQTQGWQSRSLGRANTPFGTLYLDMDRSALSQMNWAIIAVSLALALMLVTLLARVWSQETSLTRTVVELDERRRELIRLERLALAGQLSAGLLHDLRKPVLNIKHSLEDLAEALGDFAPAAEGLEDLRRQTRLFFQILTDSQIERFVQSDKAGEEYVALSPIIEFALNLVRYEQRGVEIHRDEKEGLPPVLAHPYRLIQLFSNLILNAYQAMDGQGRLSIEAEESDGGVEVRFTDNGPGIEPEAVERVFDPFYTTKPEGEGTGLGLSICRMIVEEQGGRITVASESGGATTFSVWLPAEQPKPT